jgi:hypothetical protein
MSDQKLRELERRWRETGNVEDETAYLLEQVRVGVAPWSDLHLAVDAYLEAGAEGDILGLRRAVHDRGRGLGVVRSEELLRGSRPFVRILLLKDTGVPSEVFLAAIEALAAGTPPISMHARLISTVDQTKEHFALRCTTTPAPAALKRLQASLATVADRAHCAMVAQSEPMAWYPEALVASGPRTEISKSVPWALFTEKARCKALEHVALIGIGLGAVRRRDVLPLSAEGEQRAWRAPALALATFGFGGSTP